MEPLYEDEWTFPTDLELWNFEVQTKSLPEVIILFLYVTLEPTQTQNKAKEELKE